MRQFAPLRPLDRATKIRSNYPGSKKSTSPGQSRPARPVIKTIHHRLAAFQISQVILTRGAGIFRCLCFYLLSRVSQVTVTSAPAPALCNLAKTSRAGYRNRSVRGTVLPQPGGFSMFEGIFDLSVFASSEEIVDFLELWGVLFAIVFTLRILQRIRNRIRRARQRRLMRRAAKRKST